MAETSPLLSPSDETPGLPAAADALAALRAATAAVHARLDSQLPLSRPDATLADYAVHVAIIGAWLADIDRLPVTPAAWPPGWADAQRGRRERIAADKAALPEAPAVRQATGLPAPSALPTAFGWGVAYVVEGSQLGGQMLYRRLRERLAPHPLHYLRGDGVAGQWPRFTAALRAALAESAAARAACEGADWAFASLTARFERTGVLA